MHNYRAMSSKRKSPPTKLEGGGSTTGQATCESVLACTTPTSGAIDERTPSLSPDRTGCGGSSEPDVESRTSSSPISDTNALIEICGGDSVGVYVVSGDVSSDYEEPFKKQRLELDSSTILPVINNLLL